MGLPFKPFSAQCPYCWRHLGDFDEFEEAKNILKEHLLESHERELRKEIERKRFKMTVEQFAGYLAAYAVTPKAETVEGEVPEEVLRKLGMI